MKPKGVLFVMKIDTPWYHEAEHCTLAINRGDLTGKGHTCMLSTQPVKRESCLEKTM